MLKTDKIQRSPGFTLIELIVVICIVSILASIAVLVYSRAQVSRYDEEAIASVSAIYMQANDLITQWGVGTTNYEITAGCLPVNPSNTATASGAAEMTNTGSWKKYGLLLSGPHHWNYQVCFGHIDSAEGFVIVARRDIGGKNRFIIYGSGIDTPIVDAEEIPDYALLESTDMSSFAYTSELIASATPP